MVEVEEEELFYMSLKKLIIHLHDFYLCGGHAVARVGVGGWPRLFHRCPVLSPASPLALPLL